MDFVSAVSSLRTGMATKVPSWLGYVSRLDDPPAAHSASSTYNVGDLVMYQGSPFICKVKVSTPEEFTADKWESADMPYTLVMRTKDDRQYRFYVSTSPQGSQIVTTPDSLVFDGGLMTAILSDAWVTGTTQDFETARSGSGTW